MITEFLTTKTMMAVIVGTLSQLAVRYGIEIDNQSIEDFVLNLINVGTFAGVAFGRYKAKKQFAQ